MIYFLGDSFAPRHLREAARKRGLKISDRIEDAFLIFVSQDTETDEHGNRNLAPIRALIEEARAHPAVLVLTSQVPPGFTRSLGLHIYHHAETLRIKDAEERAFYPEQHIVGCPNPLAKLPSVYMDYLMAFRCPIHQVTWEDAEFAKIAINMTLASQVENANRLSKAAEKFGADWRRVANILAHDRRIGHRSYLTPGRWQDSKHLFRDYVTLKEVENG